MSESSNIKLEELKVDEYKGSNKIVKSEPIVGIIGYGRRVETTLAKIIGDGSIPNIDVKV